MHKHKRVDFIETNLKPGLEECCESQLELLSEQRSLFDRYRARLDVVRVEKEKKRLEILGMIFIHIFHNIVFCAGKCYLKKSKNPCSACQMFEHEGTLLTIMVKRTTNQCLVKRELNVGLNCVTFLSKHGYALRDNFFLFCMCEISSKEISYQY